MAERTRKLQGINDANINPVLLESQSALRSRGINGKKMIPIAANTNTALSVLQIADAKFNEELVVTKLVHKEDTPFTLEQLSKMYDNVKEVENTSF